MKMPQMKIGTRGREAGIGNWSELEQWANSHSPTWHAAKAHARQLGLSENETLRVIAWCVLGALQEELIAANAAAGIVELNPGNEGLTQLRGHWEKILLAVMHKYGLEEVTIDTPDLDRAFPEGTTPTFAVLGRKQLGPDGGFTLKIARSQAEAIAIVAQHQGKG